MFQKNYKSILNSFFLVFLLLALISPLSALNIENIPINMDNPSVTKSFNIDKVENYTYELTYTYVRNINGSMYVNVYVNNKFFKSYSSGKIQNEHEKIEISSKYLNDGENTLRFESNILSYDPDYHPYFNVKDIQISEHSSNGLIKLPMTYGMNFLSFAILLLILKKLKW